MTEAKNGNLPRLWFSCTPFTEFGCSEISISGEFFSFSIALASSSQDPVTRIKLKKLIFSCYSVKLIITKKKKKIDMWSLRPILLYWAACSPRHFELLVLYLWPKSSAQPTSRNVGPTLMSHEPPQKSELRSHNNTRWDQSGPSNNTTNCLHFTAASNFSHPKHSWLLFSCTHMDVVALRLFLRWQNIFTTFSFFHTHLFDKLIIKI